MTVQDIISALSLQVASSPDHLDREITGGYASDLLSCVMAGAQAGNAWVTLQCHVNVVAVAALLDLACVILTEGVRPDEATLTRANEEGIPTLLSHESTFTVVGRLVRLGVAGS